MGGEGHAEVVRVLVTGGGGFLGTAICRQLLREGKEVVAFQRRAAEHLQSSGARIHRGEIDDVAALRYAAEGCDAVIHTAGKAGLWGDPAEFHRINVGGTQAVISVCRQLSIPVLVQTSSPSIVHSGADIEGADESIPIATHFESPYPATKAEAERLVLAANSQALKTTALRPHLIWGPGDPHILPHLLAKVRKGKLALPGVDKRIDTVFVDNAASAHVSAMEELQGSARCAGKAYFISNDEPLRQGEIITWLLAALGVQVTIRPIPPGLAMFAGTVCESIWKLFRVKSEPPVTRFSASQLSTSHWFNINAAQHDFGYDAAITIDAGLEILRRVGL